MYHNLGEIKGAHVFMALSEMGAGGLGASQQAGQRGIDALRPSAVIMVGIAFGLDEQKQAIGDILVAQQLWLYDLQRIGKDAIVPRGDKPHASTWLINRLRGADCYWQGATVRFGLVLTGEKLVDNLDYRDQLKRFEPEAIGGEMEGAGLYVACQGRKVDWILVKAICDWADGNKGGPNKDAHQVTAARNAASFVLHTLQLAPLKREGEGQRENGLVEKAQERDSSLFLPSDLPESIPLVKQRFRASPCTVIGNLRSKRRHHVSATLSNGDVLVAGGLDNDGNLAETIVSFELFTMEKMAVASYGAMLTRRYFAAATSLPNNTILVTGGVGEKGETVNSAELYNSLTRSFVSVGPMTTRRHGHTSVLLRNGKVLIIGGAGGED